MGHFHKKKAWSHWAGERLANKMFEKWDDRPLWPEKLAGEDTGDKFSIWLANSQQTLVKCLANASKCLSNA